MTCTFLLRAAGWPKVRALLAAGEEQAVSARTDGCKLVHAARPVGPAALAAANRPLGSQLALVVIWIRPDAPAAGP
ncbi:hypothetical protein HXX76_012557 [Chlamydomonas incerta]|uniref:Uncharacterized protein n=1 Tax=Chlamydomonas incerta TaxID=51695 RepID=A0A835VVG9_CHLIN|nr:hypothetical protein HXX76_012557 [Chlamydomonas incerta]|eukprot:KAG2427363.1 hypothetical protein HXX76_012557 [Chlamydomonas incerta]